MTKTSYLMTSLVAAIPAGVLITLMIMSYIPRANSIVAPENMNWVQHIFNLFLFLTALWILLIPVGIFLKKKDAPGSAPVPADDDVEDMDDAPAEQASDESMDDDDDDDDFGLDSDRFEDDDDGFDDFEDDDDDWE